MSAEDEHTYNSLCSDIREAWAINASNGLQIYAFPEGSNHECGKDIQVKNGGKL